jgi:hypothetical protein
VDRRRPKLRNKTYENVYVCTACIVKGFIMPKNCLLQLVQYE